MATPNKEKDKNDIESTPITLGTLQDNEKQEDPTDEAPPRDISGWKWFLTMFSILSSMFLYSLDATIVPDIQGVIIEDLGHIEKLAWLSVSLLLGATVTNVVWGRIYSQFNCKWMYILCVFLFEAGSAICGAAPTIEAMIVGRAICGVGGSGLYVGIMTLIAATTTIQERPMYVGTTGLVWGLGIVLGPIVGGAFSASSVGWRWAFYINLFIGAACAPIYFFLLPSKDPRPGVSLKERAREIDYVGCTLQTAALTMFVIAISWGGITYPWSSGQVIGLFVASGVVFILLGIQQVYLIFTSVSRRIIPVEFFTSRTILILFCMTAAAGASAFVPIYMVPIFFQFTRNDTALDAGVRLLPFIVVLVVAITLNSALLSKFGYYMPWYTAGGLLAVTGSALMYTVNQSTSTSRIYGYTVLLGTGVGMWIQASHSVAQTVVDPLHIASAVGFITLAQFTGVTIALSIANTVFLNNSQRGISQVLPDVPLDRIQAAMQGAGNSFVQSLGPDLKAKVLEAIVDSINKTYILVIAASSLVVVLSLLMKKERLFSNSTALVSTM